MGLNKIFEVLNQKCLDYKYGKHKKDDARIDFIDKIANAHNDISLFGLNYPNYFTTSTNKIMDSFHRLNNNNNKNHISVDIFIPSKEIIKEIDALKIYPKELSPINTEINLSKIKEIKQQFEYINFSIYEYQKLYLFGASAIDIHTSNPFIHVSEVKKNEFISNAEYFNFQKTEKTENIIVLFKELFKRIKTESIQIG